MATILQRIRKTSSGWKLLKEMNDKLFSKEDTISDIIKITITKVQEFVVNKLADDPDQTTINEVCAVIDQLKKTYLIPLQANEEVNKLISYIDLLVSFIENQSVGANRYAAAGFRSY